MFVRKTTSPNTKKTAIQIVESKREGSKVRQKIIQHVGSVEHPDDIERLKQLAEDIKFRLECGRLKMQPLFGPEQFTQPAIDREKNENFKNVGIKQLQEAGRYNRGIPDVFGKLFDDLGFNRLFTGQHAERYSHILKSCVLARLAYPSSKLEATRQLEKKFSVRMHVDKIYRMMDQLDSAQVKARIRKATLGLLREQVSILFYDVTTLYFESVLEDELRSFGFSKDCKFKETQVVLALITTTDGLPVTYKVFPGNTHEVKTLLPSLAELRKEFDVASVEFAADRGMFCEENLKLLEQSGINYVVGAKLRAIDRATKAAILAIHEQQDGEDSYQEKELEYRGRRVVISYNPVMAAKDRKDRQRLLDRLEKLAKVDAGNVAADAAWDGISGYITNSKRPAGEIIATYHRLWEIEASFRLTKHDLKVRPIYHYRSSRIRPHLDICFIAYALACQLRYRYKLQKGGAQSFRALHAALAEAEFSLLRHTKTKELYALPSSLSPLAKKLYRIVGLRPSTAPYKI